MKGAAFSPGHLTGFFSPVRDSDVLRMGSVGAGVNTEQGVYTYVDIESHPANEYVVRINGFEVNNAFTSQYVLRRMMERLHRTCRVTVDHYIDLPIGAGFGTSGAGALSLSLALNDALGLGLSKIGAAKIAHEAEVACMTGLGTVAAELHGGLEIREVAGAPGLGSVSSIHAPRDLIIMSLVYGGIPTHHMLADRFLHIKVKQITKPLLREIMGARSVQAFLEASNKFTKSLGLATPRIQRGLQALESLGYFAGMAMFGEVLFTLVRESEVLEVARRLRPLRSDARLIVSKVDSKGAFAF